MTVINNNKVIIICNNYYKLKKINDKIIPTKVLKYIAWSRPWWLYFTAFPQPFSSEHILHNSCARTCNPSNTFHTRDLSGPQKRAKHGRAWGHERDWMNDPQSQGVWDWVDRETANVPIKSQAPAPLLSGVVHTTPQYQPRSKLCCGTCDPADSRVPHHTAHWILMSIGQIINFMSLIFLLRLLLTSE